MSLLSSVSLSSFKWAANKHLCDNYASWCRFIGLILCTSIYLCYLCVLACIYMLSSLRKKKQLQMAILASVWGTPVKCIRRICNYVGIYVLIESLQHVPYCLPIQPFVLLLLLNAELYSLVYLSVIYTWCSLSLVAHASPPLLSCYWWWFSLFAVSCERLSTRPSSRTVDIHIVLSKISAQHAG